MGEQNQYFNPLQQGWSPQQNLPITVPWNSNTIAPNLAFQQEVGGFEMDKTSSSRSTNSSGFSDRPSSAVESPNTAMSSSESSPYAYNNYNVYPPAVYHDNNANYETYNASTSYNNKGLETQHSVRSTPSSLGWSTGTDLIKLYALVVTKGKEPYLELLPQWTPTWETPKKVHLDSARAQKGAFPCQFPTNCGRVFKRPADLERHYENVHTPLELRKNYKCDYLKCGRLTEPFTRKDHYRDHLRDYHKEDLGCAKKSGKDGKGKDGQGKDKNWERAQQAWLSERRLDPNWWRCARCLIRVYVYKNGGNGWECETCKAPCEQERQRRRQLLEEQGSQPTFKEENDQTLQEPVPSDYGGYSTYCMSCSNTGWVANMEGAWDPCQAYDCQVSVDKIHYPVDNTATFNTSTYDTDFSAY